MKAPTDKMWVPPNKRRELHDGRRSGKEKKMMDELLKLAKKKKLDAHGTKIWLQATNTLLSFTEVSDAYVAALCR